LDAGTLLAARYIRHSEEVGGVKYVAIERLETGYWLDPSKYLEQLGTLAPDLPPGAREFATEPGHYDFYSPRCVKDLTFGGLGVAEHNGEPTGISMALNDFRGRTVLTVEYRSVTNLSVVVHPSGGTGSVGPVAQLAQVQLDEILPHEAGCSHETQLIGGTVMVTCADLSARWLDDSH
jgi:hypothetical protein